MTGSDTLHAPAPEILILAAGASTRMGGPDKLLLPVGGQTMLRRIVLLALSTGAGVTVTLPPDRPDRLATLADLDLRRVMVASALGMAASLKAGLGQVPPDAPVMVVLADLPGLTAADLNLLLAEACAHPKAIIRGAGADGTPGHPVIFPPDLRPDLLTVQGDQGAQAVLRGAPERIRLVRLPGRHAVMDVDTPENWAQFQASDRQ